LKYLILFEKTLVTGEETLIFEIKTVAIKLLNLFTVVEKSEVQKKRIT